MTVDAAVEPAGRSDEASAKRVERMKNFMRADQVAQLAVSLASNACKDVNGQEVLGAITSPGNCPYAITAGAVNTKGTPFRSDDVMTTYSSRGPTADGLLKPDLLAPGNKIRGLLAPGAAIAQQYP